MSCPPTPPLAAWSRAGCFAGQTSEDPSAVKPTKTLLIMCDSKVRCALRSCVREDWSSRYSVWVALAGWLASGAHGRRSFGFWPMEARAGATQLTRAESLVSLTSVPSLSQVRTLPRPASILFRSSLLRGLRSARAVPKVHQGVCAERSWAGFDSWRGFCRMSELSHHLIVGKQAQCGCKLDINRC